VRKFADGFVLMSVIVVLNVLLLLVLVNQQLLVRNWQRLGHYQHLSETHYALHYQATRLVSVDFDSGWTCIYPVSYFGQINSQELERSKWCEGNGYQWYIEKAPFDCCLREQSKLTQLVDEFHLVLRPMTHTRFIHVLFTKPSFEHTCECPSPFVITEHRLSYQWGR